MSGDYTKTTTNAATGAMYEQNKEMFGYLFSFKGKSFVFLSNGCATY